MKKEGEADDAPEQVKTNAIVLPPLAGPEGVSAGIVFQDWLAQVAVPMQDLSSSSGIWWGQVLKLVRDTYSKWLAATPLERLQLEPMGHDYSKMDKGELEGVFVDSSVPGGNDSPRPHRQKSSPECTIGSVSATHVLSTGRGV